MEGGFPRGPNTPSPPSSHSLFAPSSLLSRRASPSGGSEILCPFSFYLPLAPYTLFHLRTISFYTPDFKRKLRILSGFLVARLSCSHLLQ